MMSSKQVYIFSKESGDHRSINSCGRDKKKKNKQNKKKNKKTPGSETPFYPMSWQACETLDKEATYPFISNRIFRKEEKH